MTQTLPQVTHEHHERILRHVDGMPATADKLLTADAAAAVAELDGLVAFLNDTLLPHVAAAEAALYPELERMFQNRHSMAPMRREHEEVRVLVASLTKLSAEAHAKGITISRTLGIRRVLFNLYAMLKIHLAEEEALLHLMDKGVTDDVAELLAAAMGHEGTDPA
jgi:iron-sulfur cluster repair protein YtfE (RIC family)